MRRLLSVLSLTVILGLAVPAHASADEVDDAFLASLNKAGIAFPNPDQAVAAGHSACQLAKSGKQGVEVLSLLQTANPGLTPNAARMFLGAALNAYCPEALPPSGN
jgi:hypothetical protein